MSDVPLAGKYRVINVNSPGRQPLSSSVSRCAAWHRRFTRINPARRDLPTPRVGDEPMTPEQQHTAVRYVDDDTGGFGRHPQHMVVEPRATGKFDVDECQTHPLAVVDRPLAVHGPTHVDDYAGTGWLRAAARIEATDASTSASVVE